MEEALLVSVVEADLLAAGSSLPPAAATTEIESVRRVDEARARLYAAFMLSLARAAFEVTEANMRAIATQYTSERRVVLCHVPTALGLAVSSSPSPEKTFQARVLPWMTEAYVRHTAQRPAADQTEAEEEQLEDTRPSVHQAGQLALPSGGQWQGEGRRRGSCGLG